MDTPVLGVRPAYRCDMVSRPVQSIVDGIPVTDRLPTDRPDDRLAERVLAGEEQAFAELFNAHRRDVYRIARAITGSHDSSLDVVQEVFVRVYQRLATWRRQASLRTWVLRIAIRCAIDSRRKAARATSLDTVRLAVDPRVDLDRDALLDRLRHLADRMSGRPGMVLRLRLLAGLSNKDIAASLRTSEPNVRLQLSRAVRRLKEML